MLFWLKKVKTVFLDGRVYLELNSYSLRLTEVRSRIMSPGMHKVPGSRMKILTKDAKQMVNGPYYCPKCRKELMQILANVSKKEVYAVCKCGINQQLTYAPVFQPIDYYNKFRDMWKKQTYGIIKR